MKLVQAAGYEEFWNKGAPVRGTWYRTRTRDRDLEFDSITFCCPKCGGVGGITNRPGGWSIDFHEDGTFTSTPSILHDSQRCGWHVYVTRGEAVDC